MTFDQLLQVQNKAALETFPLKFLRIRLSLTHTRLKLMIPRSTISVIPDSECQKPHSSRENPDSQAVGANKHAYRKGDYSMYYGLR